MKKLLRIIELCYVWLTSSNVPLKSRLLYFVHLPITIKRLILKETKSIYYLSGNFIFDDLSDVFTTLAYPSSIKNSLLDFVKINDIKDILDLGANIGQFATTTSNLLKNRANIYSFEPNKEIYEILERNTQCHQNIHIYNYGIGNKGISTLYYTKNKSAKGSIIESNAKIEGNNNLLSTEIELIDNIDTITSKNSFDLIKIDVEGYELDVIHNLKGIKCKYLLLEVTCGKRSKNYHHSELFNAIKGKFGEYNILYQGAINRDSECFDCLFSFFSQ